ncbi:MAG: hypothetical protein Q4B63_09190 [Clostridium perfringens]|nr:hypothetical protein [Clostridium perfringens]
MFNLNEDLKKIILVGIGAVATTAEKSKEVVDTLVAKGELTVEQGKVLNEELKRNLNNVKESFNKENKDREDGDINHDDDMKDYIFNNVDKLSKEELAILKAKLIKIQEEQSE